MDESASNLGRALRAIDATWTEFSAALFVSRELGRTIDRLPDIGEANVRRRAALGREIVDQLDAIDLTSLPVGVGLTAAVARERASTWTRESDWYWLVFDPLGAGFFALFGPTAYAGGYTLNLVNQLLRDFQFHHDGDADRYLGLISDYARLLGQMRERTSGQAERGIRIPRPQLEQSTALIKGLREAAAGALAVSAERVAGAAALQLQTEIDRRVSDAVLPAFDALAADLENPAYRAAAPEAVGLWQYPGGAEVYAELVRLHTTLELSPEEVHAKGQQRMERVRADIQRLFEAIGFDGTAKDYLALIESDPAWRAEGSAQIGAVFGRYIDRIAPHIERYFSFRPKAGYDVAPLPQSLSGSMTFGYYSPPNPSQEKGLYLFNAVNLSNNALPNIAALNYHELVPGHHFHIASQRENGALHPLRQFSFINAYNEGWAEYAATFAGEIGMYETPEERFGRLMMDSFLTCRLVVDTGLNALGWSLEKAREYLRQNSFMPETEIRSETLRYACDIPGQALAYKLGEESLMQMRSSMQQRLGPRFDIRAFHAAVLEPGALPLPLLARHLEAETERLAVM